MPSTSSVGTNAESTRPNQGPSRARDAERPAVSTFSHVIGVAVRARPLLCCFAVQLAATREVIRSERPQRLCHAGLGGLTGKLDASRGQLPVVIRDQHCSLAP